MLVDSGEDWLGGLCPARAGTARAGVERVMDEDITVDTEHIAAPAAPIHLQYRTHCCTSRTDTPAIQNTLLHLPHRYTCNTEHIAALAALIHLQYRTHGCTCRTDTPAIQNTWLHLPHRYTCRQFNIINNTPSREDLKQSMKFLWDFCYKKQKPSV